MIVDLKCRSCGKIFHFDFSKKEFDTEQCPWCGKFISLPDTERVRRATESFLLNAPKTFNIDICGIRSSVSERSDTFCNNHAYDNSQNYRDKVFQSDLEHLSNLYYSSHPEVQVVLSSLFDKFILLVDSDSKKHNVAKMEATKEELMSLLKSRWLPPAVL